MRLTVDWLEACRSFILGHFDRHHQLDCIHCMVVLMIATMIKAAVSLNMTFRRVARAESAVAQ